MHINAERFWSNVRIQANGCWLWGGHCTPTGYGTVKVGSRTDKTRCVWSAHRTAWTIANGDIPDGQCVLHRCDVRACVNPRHLFLGSRLDNARDRNAKGRHWTRRGEDHPNARLSVDQVLAIRASAGRPKDLAKVYRVSPITISDIRYRRRWKWLA